MPEAAQKAGVVGFHAAPGGHLVAFAPWIEGSESTLVLFAMDPGGPGHDFKPLWKSPKLPGTVLDLAIGPDPRTAKGMGLYVLESTGADGKGRTVEYYTPNAPAK